MAHTIDEDTKKIVKAIVHGDQKRQSRRRAGKHTDFDRKAAEAIKAGVWNLSGILFFKADSGRGV